MQKLKLFAIILTFILAIFLCIGLYMHYIGETEQTRRASQLDEAVGPLYARINDLERERTSLEKLYDSKINGVGTVGLLYVGAETEVYELAYSQMKEYGYSGVIALSDDSFPDEEGYMSDEQFDELLSNGWEWCVVFPADSETPKDDVTSLIRKAKANGFGSTSTVYFPEGSYTSEYDEWLSERGFSTILHHGENDMSVIGTVSNEVIWTCGAVNWRSKLRRHYLSAAVEDRGNIFFEIHLQKDNINGDSVYHNSLLSVLKEYCEDNQLEVMTPTQAETYFLDIKNGSYDISEEWEQKKSNLDAQISSLHGEIDSICKSFEEADDIEGR